jgi:hypothetical protein
MPWISPSTQNCSSPPTRQLVPREFVEPRPVHMKPTCFLRRYVDLTCLQRFYWLQRLILALPPAKWFRHESSIQQFLHSHASLNKRELTEIGYSLQWLYVQGLYDDCLDGALALLTWSRRDEKPSKLEEKAETLDMAMTAGQLYTSLGLFRGTSAAAGLSLVKNTVFLNPRVQCVPHASRSDACLPLFLQSAKCGLAGDPRPC